MGFWTRGGLPARFSVLKMSTIECLLIVWLHSVSGPPHQLGFRGRDARPALGARSRSFNAKEFCSFMEGRLLLGILRMMLENLRRNCHRRRALCGLAGHYILDPSF